MGGSPLRKNLSSNFSALLHVLFQFNGIQMAQTHAVIEQSRSDSAESSVEENPLFPIQEHVFPHTELHDQAKTNLKDRITKQGSRLLARIRGIPDSGSLFRSQDSSQQSSRRTKKRGASSKVKPTATPSEVLPTGINTSGSQPVERPLSVRRPTITKHKEDRQTFCYISLIKVSKTILFTCTYSKKSYNI